MSSPPPPSFYWNILGLELCHIRANLRMCFRTREQSVQTTYEDIVDSMDWVIDVLRNLS